MKPDEIIRRLELVRNAYIANVSDLLPEEEVSANVEAVDAAISTQKEMMELTVRAQKDEVIAADLTAEKDEESTNGTEQLREPRLTLTGLCELIAERRAGTDGDPATRVEVFTNKEKFYADTGGIFEGAKNPELTVLIDARCRGALAPRFAQTRVEKIAPSNGNIIAVLVTPEENAAPDEANTNGGFHWKLHRLLGKGTTT